MSIKHITFAMDLSMNSPGFAMVGVTEGKPIVLESSVIKPSTKGNHGERLIEIEEEIARYIEEYKPEHFVREKGFSRFNNVTQILYKVMGISEYSVATHSKGAPIEEIAVTSVKKIVTGDGKASKEDMADKVYKVYSITNLEEFTDSKGKLIDDKTDALAVGYAFLKQKELVK